MKIWPSLKNTYISLSCLNLSYHLCWKTTFKIAHIIFSIVHKEKNSKWLIFTRTVTPFEIFRWFPQIMFTLLICVRPINVGYTTIVHRCACTSLTEACTRFIASDYLIRSVSHAWDNLVRSRS